jgi:hypothetical protein
MRTIDRFLAEIEASPKFSAAARADPVWADHLESMRLALWGLERLADEDPRAIDFVDEIDALLKSPATLKARVIDLQQILIRAAKVFDPAVWGLE